jgi:glycosyltransferase involved in cell wall biosynthesis
MKILLLSRYGKLGASSRYRSYQYLPFLKQNNVQVKTVPLINDEDIQAKYDGQNFSLISVVNSYFKRFLEITELRKYDLIWIEYELFPFLPAWIEFIIKSKVPYVVDYDDAIFHRYDSSPNSLIKYFLSEKIDHVMSLASVVIVGNQYLAERAIRAGSKRVEIIPTVIDIEKYHYSDTKLDKQFTIGWIGSPSTTHYLESLKPVIQYTCSNNKAKLVVIGAKKFSIPDVNIEFIPWNEKTETFELQKIDVGIMPLDSTPWSFGKCGFKLIQYMACSKAVIASPVGVNNVIVDHGVNGFLASTHLEWIERLETLREDKKTREQMGIKGRIKVENEYCLQVTAPNLLKILISTIQE